MTSAVGFIGLGRMGRPMAVNLARQHHVYAFDPTLDAGDEELARCGVTVVPSLDDLASLPASISMLPNDAALRGALLGSKGLLNTVGAGHLHVLMGTTALSTVREISLAAETRGAELADAPVSGSVGLAESRGLTTMVGGTERCFGAIAPLLAAMTSNQMHLGPVGSGMAAKLAVNVVVGLLNEAIAEAMVVAEAGGLDPQRFYDVLEVSAGAAPYVHYKREAFLDPTGTSVSATIAIIQKDLGLADALVASGEGDLPAVRAALDVLKGTADPSADMASVVELIRRRRRMRTSI